MAAIVLVNAISHLVVAVFDGAYNPGVLTSAVLLLPLALTVYVWLVRSGVATLRQAIASLVWGVLAHVVMIAGMIASGWWGVMPESLYFAMLIGWFMLPVCYLS